MSRNTRKELEFSARTKQEGLVRAGFRCERCGKKQAEKPLECHHILPIMLARFYPELSPAILRSLANLRVLCQECHRIEGLEAFMNHQKIAQRLREEQDPQKKFPNFNQLLTEAEQRGSRKQKKRPKQQPSPYSQAQIPGFAELLLAVDTDYIASGNI